MAARLKPKVVYHADWVSTPEKLVREGAPKAPLGSGGRYTAVAPRQVRNPGLLINQLGR